MDASTRAGLAADPKADRDVCVTVGEVTLALAVRRPALLDSPGSEFQSDSELHLSRPSGRRDTAKSRRRHIDHRCRLIVVRPIEEVERLPSELHVIALVFPEPGVLPRADIGHEKAR